MPKPCDPPVTSTAKCPATVKELSKQLAIWVKDWRRWEACVNDTLAKHTTCCKAVKPSVLPDPLEALCRAVRHTGKEWEIWGTYVAAIANGCEAVPGHIPPPPPPPY